MASLGEDAGCRFSAVLLGPRLGIGWSPVRFLAQNKARSFAHLAIQGGWMVSPMLYSWLSQSWWVLLLQALTCGLDPPSTPCLVQRGRVEGGALPELVRQVEPPGQESQRAGLRRGRAEGECQRRGQRGAERVAGNP